jgi:hypothetical protein
MFRYVIDQPYFGGSFSQAVAGGFLVVMAALPMLTIAIVTLA